jgi:hypothetical protein
MAGLLVAGKDVLDLRIVQQFVIQRHDRAAGIAEDGVRSDAGQGVEDDL